MEGHYLSARQVAVLVSTMPGRLPTPNSPAQQACRQAKRDRMSHHHPTTHTPMRHATPLSPLSLATGGNLVGSLVRRMSTHLACRGIQTQLCHHRCSGLSPHLPTAASSHLLVSSSPPQPCHAACLPDPLLHLIPFLQPSEVASGLCEHRVPMHHHSNLAGCITIPYHPFSPRWSPELGKTLRHGTPHSDRSLLARLRDWT